MHLVRLDGKRVWLSLFSHAPPREVGLNTRRYMRGQAPQDFGKDAVLNPRTLREQPEEAPILGTTKIVVTMSIKGATDEELGEGMPEFTIDDITQEEM